ncbi:glycoside hydrolase family 1 protein [Nonomuraea basaltis]|uniref:glycoside hydrolase family 1 protein n=1 Tax=Nonomuraea basaltis TaxID=2495887 RepID=UPI001F1151FB|nr:family 1 glycosylhydrolase [Nonomuraea basaltis]
MENRMPAFPDSFLWGAATSGHQVEGNNTASDIWAMEHVPNSTFAAPSGDACDSYHRYPEDIHLLADAGLNAYRFSVEWSRVEPEKDRFSRAELDHYLRMAATCHERGLTPIVTLSHFTVPAWFARDGAWNQPEAPELFERYCRQVVTHFAGEVTWWVTLNEPNVGALLTATGLLAYGGPAEAAQEDPAEAFARRVGGEPGTATVALPVTTPEGVANLCEAHRRARTAVKELQPKARVGWSLTIQDFQAAEGGEQKTADMLRQIAEPFLELSKDDDFVGVQTYTRMVFGPDAPLRQPRTERTFQTGWEYYPQALGNAVRLAAGFTGVPVLVTENGIATADDDLRITYTREAITSLREAIADGTDVLGYLHWTLLDNWEWHAGYAMTFGLATVDRETFERTPKPSLHWLGQVAATNGACLDTGRP